MLGVLLFILLLVALALARTSPGGFTAPSLPWVRAGTFLPPDGLVVRLGRRRPILSLARWWTQVLGGALQFYRPTVGLDGRVVHNGFKLLAGGGGSAFSSGSLRSCLFQGASEALPLAGGWVRAAPCGPQDRVAETLASDRRPG